MKLLFLQKEALKKFKSVWCKHQVTSAHHTQLWRSGMSTSSMQIFRPKMIPQFNGFNTWNYWSHSWFNFGWSTTLIQKNCKDKWYPGYVLCLKFMISWVGVCSNCEPSVKMFDRQPENKAIWFCSICTDLVIIFWKISSPLLNHSLHFDLQISLYGESSV